jgi:hypothetical protein
LSTGTHTITFRSQDDRGDWSTPSIRTLEVRLLVPNQPPTAIIQNIAPSPAHEGDTVTFTGVGQDPDGTIEEYRWSSSIQGQLGTGRVLKISDLGLGVHTISLTVADDRGAWSSEVTRRLEVLESQEPQQANLIPRAFLEVSSLSVRTGALVHFDASNSSDPDGKVVQFFFDLGDGSQICWTVSSAVDHAYTTPGQYVVRCRVRDDAGAQSPWTKDILVEVKVKKASSSTTRSFIPGMECVLAVAAVISAVLAMRKERTGKPGN